MKTTSLSPVSCLDSLPFWTRHLLIRLLKIRERTATCSRLLKGMLMVKPTTLELPSYTLLSESPESPRMRVERPRCFNVYTATATYRASTRKAMTTQDVPSCLTNSPKMPLAAFSATLAAHFRKIGRGLSSSSIWYTSTTRTRKC